MTADSAASNRRSYTWIGLATLLIAGLDVWAYLRPDIFSSDGTPSYFLKMPYFVQQGALLYGLLIVGLAGGIALVALGRAWVLRQELWILRLLSLGWCVFLGGYALVHFINIDEMEALQTTWKILQGGRPYTDFFQHHHPLLWYQALPVLMVTGPSVKAFMALRLVQYLYTLGILAATYLITRQITRSPKTGYIAVLILGTTYFFASVGVEIRPDIAQTFFCVLSYYFLLRHLGSGRMADMAWGGLLMAVGFLFLQKALFFMLPLGLVMVYLWAKRRLTFGALLVYAAAFGVPVVVFVLYYVLTGQGETYLIFAWVINFYKTAEGGLYREYVEGLIWNPCFWAGVLVMMPYMILNRKRIPEQVWLTYGIGMILLLIAARNPRAWIQYYFPAFPMLAIPMACMVRDILSGWRSHRRVILALCLAGICLPMFLLNFQYKRYNKVILRGLRESKGQHNTYVYDELLIRNVFRKDLHYFWYSTHKGGMMEGYRHFAARPGYAWFDKAKYNDFDFCTLVETYRPAIVASRSDSPHQLSRCDTIAGLYDRSPGDSLQYVLRRE
ncbi:MAG: glycosyltransferase family 39 protein [Bacteroidia bacterium]|nr:glycosyltransferase family 39 protein [Bacteroidia bacterium]